MNQRQALKEATKRWGKAAAIRDQKNCDATPESRAAAHKRLVELNAICTTPELRKQHSNERDDVRGRANWYRYTVGEIGGVGGIQFLRVHGQGDTWEEAFAAADKRPAI